MLQGCTSPQLTEADAVIYLGDGRFHLESMMISNPALPAYRYDPYSKVSGIFLSPYGLTRLCRFSVSKNTITPACMSSDRTQLNVLPRLNALASCWVRYRYLVVPAEALTHSGTLGRQGNPKVLSYLQESLTSAGIAHVVVLLSEIFPDKLKKFTGVDAWIQVRHITHHTTQMLPSRIDRLPKTVYRLGTHICDTAAEPV